MMEPNYSVFKRFSDFNQAQEVAKTLKDNNIQVRLINNSPPVDSTFFGNTHQPQLELKIPSTEFEKAQMILERSLDIDLDTVDKEHYLFEFTDDELKELLSKQDEWGEFDISLARKILNSRGEEISDDQITILRQKRINELAEPEKTGKVWLVIGYLSSVLGGLLGVFMGYFIWSQQKTLPNGTRVYSYTASDRKHGRNMLLIGIIVFPLWLIYAFLIA